jgi:hypothetical protein
MISEPPRPDRGDRRASGGLLPREGRETRVPKINAEEDLKNRPACRWGRALLHVSSYDSAGKYFTCEEMACS